MSGNPDFVLFAQHGWADSNRAIASMAHSLATSETQVIAPNLGFLKTWLRIEPLIRAVEKTATDTIAQYPGTPIRVIGHSMGGLIWLEVLNRHQEWWPQIHSLVLVASPVGGADSARIIDPFGLGLGIARDLGIDRRLIAQKIASVIPTLSISGDLDGGSDGTVTLGCTQVPGAKSVCLPGLAHATLKNHAEVAKAIRDFWNPFPGSDALSQGIPDFSDELIQRLRLVVGMTDGHPRDFRRSKIHLTFKNRITLRTWKNPTQVDHVFVGDPAGQCLYSGFVGWLHAEGLRKVLQEIAKEDL